MDLGDQVNDPAVGQRFPLENDEPIRAMRRVEIRLRVASETLHILIAKAPEQFTAKMPGPEIDECVYGQQKL